MDLDLNLRLCLKVKPRTIKQPANKPEEKISRSNTHQEDQLAIK